MASPDTNPQTEVDVVQPPMEWFMGISVGEERIGPWLGISAVTFSDTLKALDNGWVGSLLGDWEAADHIHFIDEEGKKRIRRVKSVDELVQGKIERYRVHVQRIEDEVRQLTGFTPIQLLDRASELYKEFGGQMTAPFEILDITKLQEHTYE